MNEPPFFRVWDRADDILRMPGPPAVPRAGGIELIDLIDLMAGAITGRVVCAGTGRAVVAEW